jgi:hypothetical protein
MSRTQIAEYESLREEHMRNMEIRATLTNVMVLALTAFFSLGSLFRTTANTFYVFFFVPALVGVWGLFVYHSYEVFFGIMCYLHDLEKCLGMGWTARNPPKPLLLLYLSVLLGPAIASFYFVAALKQQPLLNIASRGVCQVFLFIQAPSTLTFGCVVWLFGSALTMLVSYYFFRLSGMFDNLGEQLDVWSHLLESMHMESMRMRRRVAIVSVVAMIVLIVIWILQSKGVFPWCVS